jgi:hypothetical protein
MQPVKQLTKEQAIKFAQSEVWKDMSDRQIVEFQLFQDKLCMPFDAFWDAVNAVFGRSVMRHEFAKPDALKAEFLGEKKPPTLEEIINMIPAEKRILIGDFEAEPSPEGSSEN